MNRYRKYAQNNDVSWEDFLSDSTYDPERAKQPEKAGWKQLKLVLRQMYEATKRVDEWVIDDKWTIALAKDLEDRLKQAMIYNFQFQRDLEKGEADKFDKDLPNSQKLAPNERAKPLIDKINQIRNMGS